MLFGGWAKTPSRFHASMSVVPLMPIPINSLGQIPIELLAYPPGFDHFGEIEFRPDHLTRDLCSLTKNGLTPRELSLLTFRTLRGHSRYCSDSFQPHLDQVTSRARFMTLEAPCGSGKTTAAINYLKTRAGTVLVISPRAQLCASLAAQMEEVAPGKVHFYKSGRFPDDARICVTTLDSLLNCFAPTCVLRRVADYILIDELSTVVQHLTNSPTLASSISTRDACFRLLLVACASAREILCLDRDIGPLELMFVSLMALQKKKAAVEGGHDLTERIEFMRMILPERIRREEIRLADIGCVLLLARQTLSENKSIAIFLPDNSACQSLREILAREFPDSVSSAIHGKSTDKLEFSQDPDGYIETNQVKAFIYNTAIGVGISITTVFDVVVICDARYLTDRDNQQAERRVRTIAGDGIGVRRIHVVDAPVPASTFKLNRLQTINQALGDYDRRIQTEQNFMRKHGQFGIGSSIDGRLCLNRTDALAVFTVVSMATHSLALSIHGLIRERRRQLLGINVVDSPIVSTALDRSLIRKTSKEARLIRGTPLDQATVSVDDDQNRAREKLRPLSDLGLDTQGDLPRDQEFMENVARGVVSASNVFRTYIIALMGTTSEAEGAVATATRLRVETEIAGGHEFDDDKGVGAATEAQYAGAFLLASGFNSFFELVEGKSITSLVIEPVDANRDLLRAFIKLNPRRYGSLYSVMDRKSVQSIYVAGVNAYFGTKVLVSKRHRKENAVSVSVGTRQLYLLLACSKHYASRAQQRPLDELIIEKAVQAWPLLK